MKIILITKGLTLKNKWSSLNYTLEKFPIADGLLSVWPSISELLSELATQSHDYANQALTRPRITERSTLDRRARAFAVNLSALFQTISDKPLHKVVACITNAALESEIDQAFVTKNVARNLPSTTSEN